jgi:hypothetical protein
VLWEQTPASPRSRVSPINLLDWKARSRTFEGMAAYVPNVAGMALASVDGNAETVPWQCVSSGIFNVLGVRPLAGRTFLPSDDAARAAVVVLSEGFWRARFEADPNIVGRPLRLDGDSWTVIGIVPDRAPAQGVEPSLMALLLDVELSRPRWTGENRQFVDRSKKRQFPAAAADWKRYTALVAGARNLLNLEFSAA